MVISSSSAAFLAANTGLVLETFENAKLPSGGLYVSCDVAGNAGWTIEAFDAGNLSLGSLSTRSGSFIRLTSTSAIARLFLNKPDSGGVIDNLRFCTSGDAVPEPATLQLLAISVAALLWLRSSKAAAQTRASALRIKTKNPRE